MSALLTNHRVALVDRLRGLEIETFPNRFELAKALTHDLNEDALRSLAKEITIAIEELQTGDRIAREGRTG